MVRLSGFIVFLGGMVCSMGASGQQPCAVKIDYAVQSAGRSHDIFLELKEGESGTVTAELYDLFKGKVVSQKSLFLSRGEATRVFTKAPPSTYVVYIKTDQCARPLGLGGLEGIKLGEK
ncbi:MAG: hypothetical protein MUC38_05590 [Cyclobacteriaceae bacterium]|nr:hypothetical protein [Cyclobacteriaceae bacterium]